MTFEHPLARDHTAFEEEFRKLGKKNGLDIVDMSYHHLYPNRIKDKLRKSATPVSLLVRTSPDFIDLNTGSYYELKTGRHTDRLNLEAYPLMCNQLRSKHLQIPCIYVYKGAITDNEIVVCDCLDIKAGYLVFPKDEKNDAIKDVLEKHFKCMTVSRASSRVFSNDAYVVVDFRQVQNWTPLTEYWKKA